MTAEPSASPLPSVLPNSDPFTGQVLAAEVQLTCGPDAPILRSRRVQAAADGVRLAVAGEIGWILGVEDEHGGDSRQLESTSQVFSLLVAPGDVRVSCADPARPDAPPTTPLRIEDPTGHHKSTAIAASVGSCVAGSNSFEEGARGEPGDPVNLASSQLTGLAAGDIVEAAGFAVELGRVRIVRSGDVIGWIHFIPDGHDGWLRSEWNLCGGLA